MQEFFFEFSSGNPCVLSRSALQILYAPLSGAIKAAAATSPGGGGAVTQQPVAQLAQASPGAVQFAELLREAVRSFIAPPALMMLKTPPFNGKQLKDCVDSFLLQCCRPMSLLLQAFGHNRARQRDKVAAVIEELAAVQEEADKLDNMLNAVAAASAASASAGDAAAAAAAIAGRSGVLFFSTWLLYHILRIMVRYILTGFELELYSQHEYPYLYWYLYELLFPWLTSCLQRADSHLQEHEHNLESQRMAGEQESLFF